MLALLFSTLTLLAAGAGAGSKPDPINWQIVPGVRVGPVTAEACQAGLKAKLGERLVREAVIPLGEGETEPGTVLWPDDPTRKLEILWRDHEHRCNPTRVIIRDRARNWRTNEGISLGTSLRRLEQINRKPFTLSGFGWDYGGTVISWEHGALDKILKGCNPDCPPDRVLVRLSPLPRRLKALTQTEHEQVLGDRPISSSQPVMHMLDPRVADLAVLFAAPAGK